jgi:hypothetical protein
MMPEKQVLIQRSISTGKDQAVNVSMPFRDWRKMDEPVSFDNVNNFRFMGMVVWCRDSKNGNNPMNIKLQ